MRRSMLVLAAVIALVALALASTGTEAHDGPHPTPSAPPGREEMVGRTVAIVVGGLAGLAGLGIWFLRHPPLDVPPTQDREAEEQGRRTTQRARLVRAGSARTPAAPRADRSPHCISSHRRQPVGVRTSCSTSGDGNWAPRGR